MAAEIVPATSEHLDRLADICYRAFKDISESHGFEPDFPSPDVPRMFLGSMIADESVHSAMALLDGAAVGSNYLSTYDDVGGVGPITVDPGVQGDGIGRQLMEDILAFARNNGIEQVRLMQDSFNMRSLALYSRLGFDTRAPVAFMDPAPRESLSVRRAAREDMDAIEDLSRRIYRVNRRHEAEHQIGGPFAPHVFEAAGRVTGYFLPGIAGHGVAESEETLVELVLGVMAVATPAAQVFFVPVTEGSLYRRFLEAGCRNRKVMNLMSLGPYEEPQGPWLPSIGF